MYDSSQKYTFIGFELFIKFFEGKSGFESCMSNYTLEFPELNDHKEIGVLISLAMDMSSGLFTSYFTRMRESSVFWANILSFKNYLTRARIMEYKSMDKIRYKGQITRGAA